MDGTLTKESLDDCRETDGRPEETVVDEDKKTDSLRSLYMGKDLMAEL